MKIFLFGSSTATGFMDAEGGWAQRLHARMNQANIANRSDNAFHNLAVAGSTAEDIIGSFTAELDVRRVGEEPCAVLFAIGTNDSQWLVNEDKERFTPEEFRGNLEKLLALARQKTQHIGFVGLTPVQDDVISPKPWKEDKAWINERVGMFNDVLRDFCRENNLFFTDSWKDWMAHDHSALIYDGLHPNTEGHARIAESVRPFFAQMGVLPPRATPAPPAQPPKQSWRPG